MLAPSAASAPDDAAADSGDASADGGEQRATNDEQLEAVKAEAVEEETEPPPATPEVAESRSEQLEQPAAGADSPQSPEPDAERRKVGKVRLPSTPNDPGSQRHASSGPSQPTASGPQCERAVSLAVQRCDAGRRTPVTDPPPGFGSARALFVRQQRPRPMTPLQAWTGYHGNVYFAPMRISQAQYSHPDEQMSLPPLATCTEALQRVLERSRLNASHVMQLRARAQAAPRQPRRRKFRGQASGPPVVQMDRSFLLSRSGSKASLRDSQDVHLYRCAHSTGTLLFQQPEQQLMDEAPASSRRVYRGSVTRKLIDLRQQQQHQQQHQQQQHQQRRQLLRHNTSVSSLDREMDRLYERLPSLMRAVPRTQQLRE